MVTCPVSAERMCFPHAAQVAVIRRKSGKRKRETVYLLTSCEESRLSSQKWLLLNRQAWSIENGLHQRLDVTAMEDHCRVRTRNSVWVLGMFRRLAVSLYCEWRTRNPTQSKYASFMDFLHLMSLVNQRRGFSLVSSRSHSLTYNVS